MLIADDGRVVLNAEGSLRPVAAMDIFRVAIRGADKIGDVDIDVPAAKSLPGITFRSQASEVVLLVQGSGADLVASPGIRFHGAWQRLPLRDQDDHVLIGTEWHPLDSASLGSVRAWLQEASDGGLTAARYVELYRDPGPGFEVVDELTDETVVGLAGGSSASQGIGAELYPYQATGLQWLSARANSGLGGILADQMGLGKTLQIIGLLSQGSATSGRPSLVVVPLTIVENWARELRKFAPALSVYRHVGPARTHRPNELAKQQVVITTYETVVSDEAILSLVSWDIVVLDEAQAIKNPAALRTKAVNALPRRSSFAVTGTPLENRTQDVWSLAAFALPGYLGSRAEFAERLEAAPARLNLALRPLILRREVADVAKDLPDKIEVDLALEMFAPEEQGYRRLIDDIREKSGRTPILALITKLRQYTAHPDLVGLTQPQPESRSAKLTRLVEILDEIVVGGEKVLIFVAFTKAADLILQTVQRSWPVSAWTLDGRTAVANRQPIVDQFSSVLGPAVLVLNPAAGGVGLNIQAATHVVHYTLEWNPAREAQATARAHRRGQDRPVTVHRLFYPNTIDEFVLEKLRAKQDLFNDVISASGDDSQLKDLLEQSLEVSTN